MRITLLLLIASLTAITLPAQAMPCPNDFHSDAEMIDYVKSATGDQKPDFYDAIDLDGDGRADRLIGSVCGNGGCDYYVFLQHKPGAFRLAGHGMFNKDAFKFIRSENPESFEILAYWHNNAGRGDLILYRNYGCAEFEKLAEIGGKSEDLIKFVKDPPQLPM